MDTTQMRPALNIPPGDFVLEAMEARGWTQENLAEVLGVSATTVNKLIKAKQSITVDMAKRLQSAFGQSAQYWLSLESNYQLRQSQGGEDLEIGRKSVLFSHVPVNALRKKGWVSAEASPGEVESWLVRLWETDDLEVALNKTVDLPMAARRSTAYSQFSEYHAAIWFQVARRLASSVAVPEFAPETLGHLVTQIPEFSTRLDGIGDFLSELSGAGVKFLVLSHLPKTYTDGAAFWDDANPVIVITARLNWCDSFWFTLAHEIGHVLLHLRDHDDFFIDEGVDGVGARESEANDFARNVLCHESVLAFFGPRQPRISRSLVERYAQDMNISPSLIVGCLHHDGVVPHGNLNALRTKVLPLIPNGYLFDERVRDVVCVA